MDDNMDDIGRKAASGWWDRAVRLADNLGRDNVSLISAGLAMYALLSIFPALAATVSIYELLVTPQQVMHQMSTLAGALPPGTWELFRQQLQRVAGRQHGSLTITAALTVLVALWSARSGMASLMSAANIAYGVREKRGLLTRIALSLLLTIGALFGFILLLVLGLAVPWVLSVLGTSPHERLAAAVARWLLLWGFAIAGLALVYRFAPSRRPGRWRWFSVGSVTAATLWVCGSALFSIYVSTFAHYRRSYGALGGVVVLLLWFYLSSFFVVLGAEINAEVERR
jgi:membrane protein